MKIYQSYRLKDDKYLKLLPDDHTINNALLSIDYNKFIPKVFLSDLLIVAKCFLYNISLPDDEYTKAVHTLILKSGISKWINDVVNILSDISKKYDLRVIEDLAVNGISFNLETIPKSFNYSFDVLSLDRDIIRLLNITDEQIKELEEIDDDTVNSLLLADGFGSFLIPNKQYTSSDEQMNTYGDIVKLSPVKFSDPLFSYRLAIKEFLIRKEVSYDVKSNRLIIGYFLNSFNDKFNIKLLLKILGILSIMYSKQSDDVDILIYSFYGSYYDKYELKSIDDIIKHFQSDLQLKLFPVDNTKALSMLVSENRNSNIVFVPNIENDCGLAYGVSSGKINIISSITSVYNIRYADICRRTGGNFLTI